jgi:hypothetical protein
MPVREREGQAIEGRGREVIPQNFLNPSSPGSVLVWEGASRPVRERYRRETGRDELDSGRYVRLIQRN